MFSMLFYKADQDDEEILLQYRQLYCELSAETGKIFILISSLQT